MLEILSNVATAYPETVEYNENTMMELCSRELFYRTQLFIFLVLQCVVCLSLKAKQLFLKSLIMIYGLVRLIYIYKLGSGWTDGLIFHALVVSFQRVDEMRHLNVCGEVQKLRAFKFRIGLLAQAYLDSVVVTSTFVHNHQSSRLHTQFYQLSIRTMR